MSTRTNRSTYRRWTWRILALLVVVLLVMVGRAVWLIRATPTYWEANQTFLQATPAPRLDALAKSIETRLPGEFTRPIGPGEGTRTLRINYDEANAWLAVRLGPYLDNQGITLPEELGQFMLTQRDGQLVLAFDYTSSKLGQRVASLFVNFDNPTQATGDTAEAVAPDKPVKVGIDKLLAGNQPLAKRYMLDQMREVVGNRRPGAAAIIDQLGRGEMVTLPTLPVDSHRVADVLGVQILPEAVELRLRVRFKNP